MSRRKNKRVGVGDPYADLRNLSTSRYGLPNDPITLKYTNLRQVFGKQFDCMTYEELKRHAKDFPVLQRLTHKTLIDPPPRPRKVDLVTAVLYLTLSRVYRLMFPMLDKLTKKPIAPASDSTRLKFDVGYDLTGCVHVGSGTVIASSVPEAGIRIDIVTGDRYQQVTSKYIGDRILVSDVAMPTYDGLGCSRNPQLVEWLEGLASNGIKIIAKLTLEDYITLKHPCFIVKKVRAHNTEIIVLFNLQPLRGELNYHDLVAGTIDENEWRNTQCASGRIINRTELDHDEDLGFDESLLHDPRDFDEYPVLSDLPYNFNDRRKGRKRDIDMFSESKCRSLVDAGFFIHSDNVNAHSLKKIQNCRTDEERIAVLKNNYSTTEAASLISLSRLHRGGGVEYWKKETQWNPEQPGEM